MKFTTKLLTLAIASSAAIVPTAFAQSADLSIAGKIFPGACTVQLGEGGIADFGDIRADTLNANEVTHLEPVSLSMDVACQSEVRFAFRGTDNAQGTSPNPQRFGLGMTPSDERIGSVDLHLEEVLVDSGTGYATYSSNEGATWSGSSLVRYFNISKSALIGFAKEASVVTGPAPIKAMQARLDVKPQIQPKNELTIDGDVQINGGATLNLIYV